jgi:transaldolase
VTEPDIRALRVKLFADGADVGVMATLAANPFIKGFTTNPTLMRKAGIADYRAFARDVLPIVGNRPISFEVFSDEFTEMADQALEIASWGSNVFVKIPVTNTRGESAAPLIAQLTRSRVQVNVTALLTADQVRHVAGALSPDVPSFVSVFAGRIADTGRDPMPIIAEALEILGHVPAAELIWASPRELLNVVQADTVGCHVITATNDVLAKLPLIGKDLDAFSLDTVKMFRQDAVTAGYTIPRSTVTTASTA